MHDAGACSVSFIALVTSIDIVGLKDDLITRLLTHYQVRAIVSGPLGVLYIELHTSGGSEISG